MGVVGGFAWSQRRSNWRGSAGIGHCRGKLVAWREETGGRDSGRDTSGVGYSGSGSGWTLPVLVAEALEVTKPGGVGRLFTKVAAHWFVDDSPEAWKLSLWFGCVGRDEVGWVAQPGREQV